MASKRKSMDSLAAVTPRHESFVTEDRATGDENAPPPPWVLQRSRPRAKSEPEASKSPHNLMVRSDSMQRRQKRMRVAEDLQLPLTFDSQEVVPLAQQHSESPEELRLERSQSLMESMHISQEGTQELRMDESPFTCIMRLVLHPLVDKTLTAGQRQAMEREGLHTIFMGGFGEYLLLGRDAYLGIFDKHTSRIDPIRLSRTHCKIECLVDGLAGRKHTYVVNMSTNGMRLDGVQLEKNKRYRLVHGQTLSLLESAKEGLMLGYRVEDPYVQHQQECGVAPPRLQQPLIALPSSYRPMQTPPRVKKPRALPSPAQQTPLALRPPRTSQEFTLGVLFASPLVGKDAKGTYHSIDDLDVKREYRILQQSFQEASKYVQVSVQEPTAVAGRSGEDQQRVRSQYPRPVQIVAKFATTETFRMMATIGCRALHFSGHGDEQHLYFEDGLGLVHPIRHDHLQELFSAGMASGGASPLRLAFVSACSSAPLAHAFVACGIPHVIGVRMNQRIEDYAAIEFTRSFYLALATGKTVASSFAIAQQAVAKSPNIRGPMEVADKFMLLPEDGDHDQVIFPLDTVGPSRPTRQDDATTRHRQAAKLWFEDLPALCQGFCNRSVEVYKISLALMLAQSRTSRLVTILGQKGIGKTVVAHAVAHYVGPRLTSESCVKILSVHKIVDAELDELSDEEDFASDSNTDEDDSGVRNNCRVLPRVVLAANDFLVQLKTKPDLHTQQRLLVLDGCDYLLRTAASRIRFRRFLADLLTDHSLLKIVVTARSTISCDGVVPGHVERVQAIPPFTAKMSVKMLLSLMSRPLKLEELTLSHVVSEDKREVLASHPVLLATGGVPQKIAELAGKLNHARMDDLHVEVVKV